MRRPPNPSRCRGRRRRRRCRGRRRCHAAALGGPSSFKLGRIQDEITEHLCLVASIHLWRDQGCERRQAAIWSIHKPRIWDFRGSDSSRFLISRGGILRSTGDFPEIQSQRFSVCGFFVVWINRTVAVSGMSGTRRTGRDSPTAAGAVPPDAAARTPL